MLNNQRAMLWADPGAGKTSITLTVFVELQRAGLAKTMLVIAPLRVCELVWRQEAAKWSHLRHLRFVKLHGPKKDQLLKEEADVYLLNYEGVDWLCDKYWRRQLPFDVVVSDEVTKLKNHAAKRCKKLRPCTVQVPWKYGLTGTPTPNGYMDLFGQFLWLDGGAALGQFITHFRDQYFKPGYTGFDYTLQTGAAQRIEDRLAPYVYRLAYDAMPVRNVPIEFEFDKKSLAVYREMKKESLIELRDGVVTAANAAAVQGKLSQLANGAVYLRAGEPEFAVVHDLKLDALEELIEEMNGQQLLIAYEFEHDLIRIQKRFPKIPVLRGNEKQVQKFEDDWNAGKISCMLVHPASVGHGLNLQKSSARHICWFSATFNLEHWDQLIRRLRRQGSDAKDIINHILVVKGTVDELKLEVLGAKDVEQEGLLTARVLQGLSRYVSEETHESRDRPGLHGGPRVQQEGGGPVLRSGGGEAVRDGRLHSDCPLGASSQQPDGERVLVEGPDSPVDGRNYGGQAARAASRGPDAGVPRNGAPLLQPAPSGAADHEPPHQHGDQATMSTGFKRLSRQGDEQPQAETPQQTERVAPKGWGKPAAQPVAEPAANKEAIRARVTTAAQVQQESEGEAPVEARRMFSPQVQAALAGADAPVQEQAEKDTVSGPKPAEDKPAPKARAPRAATKEDKVSDAAADVAGVDRVNYAGNAAGGVSVSLHGLPPTAIKAALQAIANAL